MSSKMKRKFLTIVTPTYNRAMELAKLHASLKSQTDKDFCWLIIDDGSTDNTFDVIKKMKRDANGFSIEYIRKENGGKHTALNLAFKKVKTELLIIVDSDDYITNDAVETIKNDWAQYNDGKICGLCYKRGRVNGEDLSDDFGSEVVKANYKDFIVNAKRKRDKAEVFRTSVFSKYSFPVFEGEKFLGEGVLWCKISDEYDMVFINKVIYICEYLEGGLTKSGRRLRIENPLGGMYYASEFLDNRYNWGIRMERALLYLTFARFARENITKIRKKSDHRIILDVNVLPSFLLYNYWRKKYEGRND